MMAERSVEVDHSSLNHWVLKRTPLLEMAFRKRKRPVGTSWRLDETYILLKGRWKYLCRAVDKAAIERVLADSGPTVELRQSKYLNNIVEQDCRAIKRMTRPMLGFRSFWSAAITLVAIELMRIIRKGQLICNGKLRAAKQFYSLAG